MTLSTVAIQRRLLALHMYSHAVAVSVVERDAVQEIVAKRKAELTPEVAERTVFLYLKDREDAEIQAMIDALEQTAWEGIPFATALWGIVFEQDVDAVHFVLRFGDLIVTGQ